MIAIYNFIALSILGITLEKVYRFIIYSNVLSTDYKVKTRIYQRRKWQPTPVLLPGISHGWRSLVGYIHGVAKSRTRLSSFTFTFHFHALEKEMATHSSVLAWRIPGTEKPGGLLCMGLHRVGHDWCDLAASAKIYLLILKQKFFYWRQLFYRILLFSIKSQCESAIFKLTCLYI